MKNYVAFIIFLLVINTVINAQEIPVNKDSTIVSSIKTAGTIIEKIDKDFDNSVISKIEDLNEIKKQIYVLANKNILTPTEVQTLTVLTNKKVLREDELFNNNRNNTIIKLETRYETGFTILNTMLIQLLNLQSKYKDLKLYKTYSGISNPMQYKEFNQNIEEIQKKLKRKKFDISLPSPLTEVINKNPTIATGYSLVTTILSTLPAEDKSEKFKIIRDVLTLTSAMQSDLNSINNEIDYLDSRVSSFLNKSEKFFLDYTSVIGYVKTYKEYIDNSDAAIISNMQSFTFREIINQVTSNKDNYLFMHEQTNKEIEVTFNLIRLVDLINEYKSVLIETENYYTKFEKNLEKYNSTDYPELNVNATLQNGNTFKQELEKLENELLGAKEASKRALKASDISEFEIRKILYGKPKN